MSVDRMEHSIFNFITHEIQLNIFKVRTIYTHIFMLNLFSELLSNNLN